MFSKNNIINPLDKCRILINLIMYIADLRRQEPYTYTIYYEFDLKEHFPSLKSYPYPFTCLLPKLVEIIPEFNKKGHWKENTLQNKLI